MKKKKKKKLTKRKKEKRRTFWLTRTLCGLRSWWTTPCSWRYDTALASWYAISKTLLKTQPSNRRKKGENEPRAKNTEQKWISNEQSSPLQHNITWVDWPKPRVLVNCSFFNVTPQIQGIKVHDECHSACCFVHHRLQKAHDVHMWQTLEHLGLFQRYSREQFKKEQPQGITWTQGSNEKKITQVNLILPIPSWENFIIRELHLN